MNWLIFQNPYEFFQFYFYVPEIPFSNKIEAITVELLVQVPKKILVCAMESRYRNIPKIHNVTSIFRNFSQKLSKTYKKSEILHIDSSLFSIFHKASFMRKYVHQIWLPLSFGFLMKGELWKSNVQGSTFHACFY